MDIEIRRLTPELTDDYIHFFDITPHSERPDKFKCYCVCWSNEDHNKSNRSFLSSETIRRNKAIKDIADNKIQGYLAYSGEKVVGWCNANTKADCLNCISWRWSMDNIPIDENDSKVRIKSIFCFAIAPDFRRKGIAQMLLENVCRDAWQDGFNIVEAYPKKTFKNEADDFMGPADLFKKNGLSLYYETNNRFVMRKTFPSP